jgi:hypothetical protein
MSEKTLQPAADMAAAATEVITFNPADYLDTRYRRELTGRAQSSEAKPVFKTAIDKNNTDGRYWSDVLKPKI